MLRIVQSGASGPTGAKKKLTTTPTPTPTTASTEGGAVVGCSWAGDGRLLVSSAWAVVLYDVVAGDEPRRVRQWAIAPVEAERVTVAAVAQARTRTIIAAHGACVRCWVDADGSEVPRTMRSLPSPVRVLEADRLASVGADVALAAVADGRVYLFSTMAAQFQTSSCNTLQALAVIDPPVGHSLLACRVAQRFPEAAAADFAGRRLATAALRVADGASFFKGIAPQRRPGHGQADTGGTAVVVVVCTVLKGQKKGSGPVLATHVLPASRPREKKNNTTGLTRSSKRKRPRRGEAQSDRAQPPPTTTESSSSSSSFKGPVVSAIVVNVGPPVALVAPTTRDKGDAKTAFCDVVVDGRGGVHVFWQSATTTRLVWTAFAADGHTPTFRRDLVTASPLHKKKGTVIAAVDGLVAVARDEAVDLYDARFGARTATLDLPTIAAVDALYGSRGGSLAVVSAAATVVEAATGLLAKQQQHLLLEGGGGHDDDDDVVIMGAVAATATSAVLLVRGPAAAAAAASWTGNNNAYFTVPADAGDLCAATADAGFRKRWRAAAAVPEPTEALDALRRAAEDSDRGAFEAVGTAEAVASDAQGRLAGAILDLAAEHDETALWGPFRAVIASGQVSLARRQAGGQAATVVKRLLRRRDDRAAVLAVLDALVTHVPDAPDWLLAGSLKFAIEARADDTVTDNALDNFLIHLATRGQRLTSHALRLLDTAEAAYLVHVLVVLVERHAIDVDVGAGLLEAVVDAKFADISVRAAVDQHLRSTLDATRQFAQNQIDASDHLFKLGAAVANAVQTAALPTTLSHYVVEDFQMR